MAIISNSLGLAIVILTVLAFLIFALLARRGFRPEMRLLSAYQALPGQVGQAVESGGRMHISLGPNSIVSEDAATTVAGLAALEYVAGASAISDQAPVGTTADATALFVIADALRRAYRIQGTLEKYDRTAPRLLALDPVALAGAATSVVADDDVRANVLIGSFGPEAALIAEAGARQGISQTIGSDRLEGQAVAYVMADHPLIGEELYVASAYLTGRPAPMASLAAQDVLRWVVIIAIIVGAVMTTLGVLR